MRRGPVFVIVIVGASAGACLFPSLGGLTDAGDASTNDATFVDGGADANVDTGVPPGWVLIGVEDFEDGGCGPFNGTNGPSQPTTTSHSGTTACEACFTGGPYFTLDPGFEPFVFPVTVGEAFAVRAWMRTGETTNDTVVAMVNVRVFGPIDGGPLDYLEGHNSPNFQLDASFRELENAPIVSATTGTGLNVYLGGGIADAGDCFIVDDITVYRITDGG